MRLDKYISKFYLLSRSESKKLIKSGLVRVGTVIVKKSDYKVPEDAEVFVRDKLVEFYDKIYIALNKPEDYVCSREFNDGIPVFELIERNFSVSLSVVGRLDKDSTGLVLLSNDGDFIHRVITPKKNVEKEYIVGLESDFDEGFLKGLLDGVYIGEDEFVRARRVERAGEGIIKIVLTEGKYHEIKRMAIALGNRVTSINRVRIGGYKIPEDLKVGKWVLLNDEELKKITGE